MQNLKIIRNTGHVRVAAPQASSNLAVGYSTLFGGRISFSSTEAAVKQLSQDNSG
jgi:hypothetical protein